MTTSVKQQAFIEALSVVDEYFKSVYGEQILKKQKPIDGKLNKLDAFELGEKVRSAYNKLILSSENLMVFELFKRVLQFDKREGDNSADLLMQLRMEMRRDLMLSPLSIGDDKDACWFLTCG